MYQWLYIQLDKEDNILKNGKSSWWVEMKIIYWDEKAGWVSGEMHRRHCNGERETRQSFKEECSCKQQLACSDVLCIHTMCARKDINRAVVVVAGKYFRKSFLSFSSAQRIHRDTQVWIRHVPRLSLSPNWFRTLPCKDLLPKYRWGSSKSEYWSNIFNFSI